MKNNDVNINDNFNSRNCKLRLMNGSIIRKSLIIDIKIVHNITYRPRYFTTFIPSYIQKPPLKSENGNKYHVNVYAYGINKEIRVYRVYESSNMEDANEYIEKLRLSVMNYQISKIRNLIRDMAIRLTTNKE